jgi:hypothetical protein
MAETDADREKFIISVLRKLARQRVSVLLVPGDIWVIENALEEKEDVAEALRTCHMRGWVEPLVNAVPTGALSPNGPLHSKLTTTKPLYRLTDSGWNAINRKLHMDVFNCIVAATSLVVSLVALVVAFVK